MSFDANEEHLVELISWLEIAGHAGDAKRNLADFFNGKPKSCKRTGYQFSRIETDGVLEVEFWFPLTELEKVCPINDKSALASWLKVISDDGIEAKLVEDNKIGECVLIKRLHSIPVEHRKRFISPAIIPAPDFAVLSHLLNLRIQQSNQNSSEN